MNTLHNLDFEVAPWEPLLKFPASANYTRFRVGTCEGLWTTSETTYDILAIDNTVKGNGHFEDVLQWFSASCKRDKKDLRFLEVMNPRFMTHLIVKRGFKKQGNHVIKSYKKL